MEKKALLVLITFVASMSVLISQNQNNKLTKDLDSQSFNDSTTVIEDSAIVVPENLDVNINKFRKTIF